VQMIRRRRVGLDKTAYLVRRKIGLDKVAHLIPPARKRIGLDKVATSTTFKALRGGVDALMLAKALATSNPATAIAAGIPVGLSALIAAKALKKNKKAGLDKAAVDTSGLSQLKQRRTIQRKRYTAEGTGLGAAGGGFGAYKMTKALGPKWNIPATLAGTLLGGAAGRYFGRKGSKTKTKVLEGVIKKQEKSKDNRVKAPAIKRHNLSGLLAYNR
jgi:hypothetical protein